MNIRKLACVSGCAATLITLVGAGAVQADSKTAIDKGGAYCFQFASNEPGAMKRVLYLDIDPADHPIGQRLWWATGVAKGSNGNDPTASYVDSLSGSATLAKPNNARPGAKLIQMALTGTSFGTFTDPKATGIWDLTYNLQLNRKTLKGTILGLSVFTPISGQSAGTTASLVLNEKIVPMNCKKF